jgi:hypothetical protein
MFCPLSSGFKAPKLIYGAFIAASLKPPATPTLIHKIARFSMFPLHEQPNFSR